jgi:hypothetical protein
MRIGGDNRGMLNKVTDGFGVATKRQVKAITFIFDERRRGVDSILVVRTKRSADEKVSLCLGYDCWVEDSRAKDAGILLDVYCDYIPCRRQCGGDSSGTSEEIACGPAAGINLINGEPELLDDAQLAAKVVDWTRNDVAPRGGS